MNDISVEGIVRYVHALKEKEQQKSFPANLPEGIRIRDFMHTKLVSKPWGFELWLANEDSLPYALKMIHVKQGTKTSLQYHKQKTEHNVVFAGQVKLHYEDAKTGAIVSKIFFEGCVIEVRPPSIHRIEALTDVFLIEVSSNHLDDVVRIQDDYNRPDGKIAAEHSSNL